MKGGKLGLKRTSLLHIGDIHFPELKKAGPLGDLKGGLPSQVLVDGIVPQRIVEISKSIAHLIDSDASLLGAIQTGDITTRGNLNGYEEGIAFLTRMLQMETAKWAGKSLVVVPGNHDINRASVKYGTDPTKKFEPLIEAWNKTGAFGASFFSGAPSAIDHSVSLPSGIDSQIRIIPLNTCLMCGEFFSLPDSLKGDLTAALDKIKDGLSADDYADLLIDQVDCPAVSRDDVIELTRLVNNSGPGSVSIIAGHHPLLPQPTPRISGYVELINAGYIRESILSTERNTVYLHGHIHQDPLLVVSKTVGGNRILHISAPALHDGFNLIELYFSDETGQAVGMSIIPYRFGDQLALARRAPLRLRLVDDSALWNEIDQEWMNFILSQLPSPSSNLRYNDLFQAIPTNLSSTVQNKEESHSRLQEALTTLELLEIVQITNQKQLARLWQLRRRSV